MKFPIILVRIQYFHGKSDSGVPGEECAHCNHWKTLGITVLFACQRRRAENWWNGRKFMKFMDFYEISGNSIKSNENHEILCFQPSATLHGTLLFLRKKHGLGRLALQGARKTGILVKFQRMTESAWNSRKCHKLSGITRKACFGVPGSE